MVVTSGPLTNDIRAENDVTKADESTASTSSSGGATTPMALGTLNGDNVKGANENASIDEKKASSLNDEDNGQPLDVEFRDKSLPEECISSSIDDKKDDKNKNNESIENDNDSIYDENDDKNENNKQSDSDDTDSTSSGDDSDSDIDSDSDKPDDGISAYERLRIERIRRNEERLKQLGLVDPNKKNLPTKKKRVSLGGASQKRSKENVVPVRSQPKRSAKRKLIQGELLSGGQIDLRRSGPMRQSYKDRFGRQKKTKTIPEKDRYSKRYRCGECRACKRETDCQTCYFCAINQRQYSTSTNTIRRRCLFRMCLRRLVDVEVEVEPEVEESDKAEAKLLANESPTEATIKLDKTIDKDNNAGCVRNEDDNGDFDKDNAIVTEEIDTNVDRKVDGNDDPRKQKSQLKIDADDELSAKNSACTNEKCKDDKNEEAAKKKVPIEDSEYFASYQKEGCESGLPKWLDEFHEFMATIPHGPMNRVSGQKNADNTMSQICKLVTGEGVTYHLWPEGTHFKKGIKIHLGMDLSSLHQEAVTIERRYEDRRKGSLLRHPIAKLICYKEWIANGKPTAAKEPIMSPLLTLPPPTNHSSDENKNRNNGPKLKKRIIAMTIEQRIKSNRVRWASDTQVTDYNGANFAGDKTVSHVANGNDKNTTNKSFQNRNNDYDSKSSDGSKLESNLTNHDEKITTNDGVENGNNMNNTEVAQGVNRKIDNNVSQGDNKENKKEILGSRNGETKSSNEHDKDTACTTINQTNGKHVNAAKELAVSITSAINETNRHDGHATKVLNNDSAATKNQTVNAITTNTMPSSCSVCSGGGDLICCDGCNRGFHSNCHFPKIKQIPLGEWFCKDCKRKKKPQRSRTSNGPKREAVVNHKLFQGEHDDDCYICYLGGDLICCDFCEKSYHLKCHIPPLPFVPEGLWKCCECLAVERKKKSRCGECEACTRDDCGKCKFCLDKPKFGGFNKLKQVCMKKVCPYPRFAPPASSTTVAGAITSKESTKKGNLNMSAYEQNQVLNTSKKCGRPRQSVNNDTPVNENRRKRGRPRKSAGSDDLTMIGNAKKRGRPRKSVEGDNLATNSSDVATATKKRRGRPKKSVNGDHLAMNSGDITSTTKKRRGRPRKSIDSGGIHKPKRVKIEADDEELMNPPVVFSFKISSFKKAYKDTESIKIRRVIKSALRDPTDYKVVDKACEHLRKCMKSVESVKTAMLFGGVEMICNAMRDHLEKNILQAEACCTLAEMIWVFPGISTKLAHMGVIDLIVTSIHSCPNNSKVQQMGCGALGAFSYDENFTQHIMDAGGVQAVVAAMERFPKKVAVLREGCFFFQNLIVRSADALSAVSNSEVVPIIVGVMSTENLGTEILLPICGLIANLAVNKEAKEFIGQSDAISATISVLNSSNDGEVKQAACTVLKNLAIGSSGNQTKITEKGGLDALFGAIRIHPGDALLLILSFNVMKELCVKDEEIAYQIVDNGGIKIILKAMQKNSDLAAMQVAACEIIGYLFLEGKSEIHAPKLVKAIVTAMKNHSEVSDVQIQGCDALFELSQISTTRLILKKQETQELLLKAKSQFKSCESDVDDIIAASNK